MEQELPRRYKLIEKAKNNLELQKVELETCKLDILYWFKNYAYTDKNMNLYSDTMPTTLPFIPYKFQEELILEVRSSILNGTKPLKEREDLTNVFIEKSRQMGLSWAIIGVFVYGYIFHHHKYHVISQKESDVDKIGDIRSLFVKARFILNNLPKRMQPPGYSKSVGTEHNKYMTLSRSDGTGSITGESANPNASRSGTYNAIFLDEMAFMQNATTINTAAAAATPCRIFNSTPNGEGNEFYRMRDLTMKRKDDNGKDIEADIKGLRYHWTDHPLYDMDWYNWKIKGMSKEKIAQELEIDYNTAVVGRVYGDFSTRSQVVVYDPSKPLYVAMDNSHGGDDPNAILCIQLEDHYYNVIDSIEVTQPPLACAEFMSCQPRFSMTYAEEKFLERYKKYNRQKAIFISDPYDTKSALGNSTILDDYKSVGINLFLPQERDKEQQIQKTRSNIYKIRYNDNCLDFASAILNAKYPERKETSNSTVNPFIKPVHNWTSHYRTALEYFITYILENPIIKKERVLQDTRPKRNMLTGKLVYSS